MVMKQKDEQMIFHGSEHKQTFDEASNRSRLLKDEYLVRGKSIENLRIQTDIYTELLKRMRVGATHFEDASRAAFSTIYGRNFIDRRPDAHGGPTREAAFDRGDRHLKKRNVESATQTKSRNSGGSSGLNLQKFRSFQPIFREHSFTASSALSEGAKVNQRTKFREFDRKFRSELDLRVGPPQFHSTPIPKRTPPKSFLSKNFAQAPRLSKPKPIPVPKPIFHSVSPPTKDSGISTSFVFPGQRPDIPTANEQLAEVRRQLEEIRQMVQRPEKPEIVKAAMRRSRSLSALAPPRTSNTVQQHPTVVTTLPFVAGKATTKSHSLRANVQELLSTLKLQHPQLRQTFFRISKTKPSLNGKTPLRIDLLELSDAFQVEMAKLINESKEILKNYLTEYDFLILKRNSVSLSENFEAIDRELQTVALKLEQQDLKVLRMERQLARLNELIGFLHRPGSSNPPECQTNETIVSGADGASGGAATDPQVQGPAANKKNQIFRHTWASFQKKSEKKFRPNEEKIFLSKDEIEKIRKFRCSLQI